MIRTNVSAVSELPRWCRLPRWGRYGWIRRENKIEYMSTESTRASSEKSYRHLGT